MYSLLPINATIVVTIQEYQYEKMLYADVLSLYLHIVTFMLQY